MGNENKKYLPSGTMLKEKYFIGAELGQGGFGMTYVGFDQVLQQKVAVKEFFPVNMCQRAEDGIEVVPITGSEAAFEERKEKFRNEAALIFGSFDIPGICNIKDYFEENGTAYIVEEYLAGGTLHEYLDTKGKMNIAECRENFTPVLSGLCKLHSMGILHLDISPDNLMFDGEGKLKLIDFGAARDLTENAERVELKTSYASPEQFVDSQITGPWTDIFSLCATMYTSITGHKPVTSAKRINGEPLKGIENLMETDSEFATAILQGLELDIRNRYFHAGILMDKLGMDDQAVKPIMEKTRSVWGDGWLAIITEQKGEFEKNSFAGINSKKWARRIAVAIAAVVAVCVVFVAAGWIHMKVDSEGYFEKQAEKARNTARSNTEVMKVAKGSKEYKKIMAAAEQSGSFGDMYSIAESTAKKLKLESNRTRFFYMKHDMVERIADHYFGDMELSDSSFNSSIFVNDNKEDALSLYMTKKDKYMLSDGQQIEISYDVTTGKVSEIYMTCKEEAFEVLLIDVLPYLVPETYLTKDEIEGMFEAMRSDEFRADSRHPKFALSGSKSYLNDEMVNVRISAGII